MKPVAWIKIRELGYMKGVVEHGASSWSTNLGLVPEPDDEGLYTETQVQQLLESFEQSVTDPENQPSQYGTVPLTTGLTHYSDEQLLFELVRRQEFQRAPERVEFYGDGWVSCCVGIGKDTSINITMDHDDLKTLAELALLGGAK